MIDLMFKASSKQTFEQWALQKGWLRTSKDEQGNEVLASASGVDVDYIGEVVLTPAVYDPETKEVLTPAEVDTDFYINVRLSADKAITEKQDMPQTKVEVNEGKAVVVATKFEESNATVAEFAEAVKEDQALGAGWKMTLDKGWVVCLDPTTIPTPPRIWQ